MAHKLFSKPSVFAEILELNEIFIKNLSCLHACVSSSKRVKSDKIFEVALET